MCSRRTACRLNHLRGSDGGQDVFCTCPSFSSCDPCCLAQIISICRTYEQAAEGDFLSQDEAQRRSRHREKWLPMCCLLFFAFTFLMGSIGKKGSEAQDYDADVFLPSQALWLLGCLLFWMVWMLLHLLQMLLWFIKGLLWFISISAPPLCRCVSFLLSCILLLLHHTCDALFYATTCPVYIYGMFLGVVSLLILTRWRQNVHMRRIIWGSGSQLVGRGPQVGHGFI